MITSAIFVLPFSTIRLGTLQNKVNKWESNQTDTRLVKGTISKMLLGISGKERRAKSFQESKIGITYMPKCGSYGNIECTNKEITNNECCEKN